MKRKVWAGVGIIIILILFAFATRLLKLPEPSKVETIKIGAILPLTGDAAQYGKACQRGIDLAIEQQNAKNVLDGRKIQIIYEDSQAIPTTAVSAINKLISVDNVFLIVGDMFSSTTLAIAPIAQRNKVVLISPTASAQTVPLIGDHIFSIYPSDAYDGQFLGGEVIRLWPDFSHVAIVYAQAEAMVTCKDAFKAAIKDKGIEFTSEDGVPPGTRDLSTMATRVAGGNPQVVFCALYLPDMAALLRVAARQGMTAKFIGISTCYDPQLFELAGKDADGLVFSAPFFDVDSNATEVKSFVSIYERRYREKPNVWAAYGYDVICIAARGIQLSKGDRLSLTSAIGSISGFLGATGTTSFNYNRTVTKDMRLLKVNFATRTFTLITQNTGK